MADIKTRDVIKGTIKTIDKGKIISSRMKQAYAKTKEKINEGTSNDNQSAQDYATGKSTAAITDLSHESVLRLHYQGEKAFQTARQTVIKRRHESYVVPPSEKAFQKFKSNRSSHNTIKRRNAALNNHIKDSVKGTIQSTTHKIKNIKTAQRTVGRTSRQAASATRRLTKTTGKTVQAARSTAKRSAETAKTVSKAAVNAVKGIVTSTKALFTAIVASGWVALLIILIIVLFGAAVTLFGGGGDNAYTPVSPEVEAYTPLIQKYAKQYGVSEYTELIKAVMMQESGGRGTDPMQASECGFNTRYPKAPNAISNPEYSIEVGIQNLAVRLFEAGVKNPIDMDNIKLALQGYNFGNGYISWAKASYGGYTYANAVEYSNMMATQHGWSSYGDTEYVAHVLRYYPFGHRFSGVGNQAIVQVALSQVGNVGGQSYWSWYGFSSYQEWCACFVSWCAEQCGYIESGVMPKFSYCQNGVDWFKARGQWQGRGYEPSPGDVIFFDYDNNGVANHVGLVEKTENGMVYTIEGNSGNACKQWSYPVGSSSIMGYGCPAI